jgi:hypothetical protein
VKDADPDTLNEIQTLSLTGMDLALSKSNSVNLSPLFSAPVYTGPDSLTVPGTSAVATFEISAEFQGHLYVLFSSDTAISWLNSQDLARLAGGYLVTVTNQGEQDFVRQNLLNHPTAQGYVPLGFTDAKEETNWMWITGEIGAIGINETYTNWASGQPAGTIGGVFFVPLDFGGINSASDASRKWRDFPGELNFFAPGLFFEAVIVEFGWARP